MHKRKYTVNINLFRHCAGRKHHCDCFPIVIASKAKQSSRYGGAILLNCFVALLFAMTIATYRRRIQRR